MDQNSQHIDVGVISVHVYSLAFPILKISASPGTLPCSLRGSELMSPIGLPEISAGGCLSTMRFDALEMVSIASFSMRETRSSQVGMSWMRPMTWPAVHTCAALVRW